MVLVGYLGKYKRHTIDKFFSSESSFWKSFFSLSKYYQSFFFRNTEAVFVVRNWPFNSNAMHAFTMSHTSSFCSYYIWLVHKFPPGFTVFLWCKPYVLYILQLVQHRVRQRPLKWDCLDLKFLRRFLQGQCLQSLLVCNHGNLNTTV
jgi:hypothetical protein